VSSDVFLGKSWFTLKLRFNNFLTSHIHFYHSRLCIRYVGRCKTIKVSRQLEKEWLALGKITGTTASLFVVTGRMDFEFYN
jgi:hypothetical protein